MIGFGFLMVVSNDKATPSLRKDSPLLSIASTNDVSATWHGTIFRSDEGLTVETSALKLFTVASLLYQLSW